MHSARRSFVFLLLLSLLAVACAGKRPPVVQPARKGDEQRGYASWYGKPYHGRPTASGEIYDMHEISAAHPSLPFGTVVRITNLRNGRTLDVRINDRGPFVDARIIDVSYKAAKKLRMVDAGVVPVKIVVRSIP